MWRVSVSKNAVLVCLAVGWIVPVLVSPGSVSAEVVRVEVASREVISSAPKYGRAGPYEVIRGVLHFAVDPDHPANDRIVDLRLAERNRLGMVEFSADFELHKPVDPNRGNHRLLYFVNNRGNRIDSYHFSHQAGRNWGIGVCFCTPRACHVIEPENRGAMTSTRGIRGRIK